MISFIRSSQYPVDQPPWSTPPSQFSPGPPGACITPSMVRNSFTTSCRMALLPALILWHAVAVADGPDPVYVHRPGFASGPDPHAALSAHESPTRPSPAEHP